CRLPSEWRWARAVVARQKLASTGTRSDDAWRNSISKFSRRKQCVMRVEQAVTAINHDLPLEIHAALDLLFDRLAVHRGVMQVTVLGDDSVTAAFAHYGTISASDRQLAL